MSHAADQQPQATNPTLFRPLSAPGEPVTAAQLVAGLYLADAAARRQDRPRVIVNLVTTVDGRPGSCAGTGASAADRQAARELRDSLRLASDALMDDARTIRVSRNDGIVRVERDGKPDLRGALAELAERFEVRTLLCEGGPHLSSQLLGAGVVDELLLSLSPELAGGEEIVGRETAPTGVMLEHPVELELLSVLESGSLLLLRYGVRA